MSKKGLEQNCLRFWDILGGQVQNDLKTLGNRFLGSDLNFLKNDQKWVFEFWSLTDPKLVRDSYGDLPGYFGCDSDDFCDFSFFGTFMRPHTYPILKQEY